MPVYSRQDVYARHLTSDRGYPLWTPEPNMSLPHIYLREGLKIGDVGVVVPEDGSFDVFFNVCLPATHPLHTEKGVPDNFTPIFVSGRDVARFPEAEDAGCVISGSSVTMVKSADVPQEDPERRAHLGPLRYEFMLSSSDGAVLVLPEGAEHWYLRNELPFRDQAIEHAVDWYTFATQRLGRVISNDSLYMITGFHKSRSWALASYQQRAGGGEDIAQFKATQIGGGSVTESYSWETTQVMDRRVGPSDRFYNGIPNQTVFIQGLKIAIRESVLRKKRVNVKADVPSVRPYSEPSSGPWSPSLWSRSSGSGKSSANTSKKANTSTENDLVDDQNDSIGEDIAIQSFPQAEKPFHPSDIINQLLLQKFPRAIVAVTHDNDWISLFQRGLLRHGEGSQKDRLIMGVIKNYSMVQEREAVYLQSAGLSSRVDNMALNNGGIRNSVIPKTVLPDHSPRLVDIQSALTTRFPSSLERQVEAELRTLSKTSSKSETDTQMIEIQDDVVYDLTGHVAICDNSAVVDSGALANIYKGHLDIKGGLMVAISVYKLRDGMMQIRREIDVRLKLDHPNILPLFGTITDPSFRPEIPAMISPWVEKGELTTYLMENNQLSVSRRLDIVDNVARGLQYLHSQQVVHGDLSGENVLVRADGSACIANFGFSRFLTDQWVSMAPWRATERYLAPELLRESETVMPNMQTDVYSFGSITLQILTGRIPYHYLRDDRAFLNFVMRKRPQGRPDHTMVTDNRWNFIEWCWSPAHTRPSSDQLVEFTGKELAESMAMEV